MEFNLDVLKWFMEIRSPFLNTLVQFFTRLGEEVIVLGVICLLFWCIDKNMAYRIGMGFFVSGILVQGLKVTFKIDRPWILDSSIIPVESAIDAATGYSFPSGHTQSAAALYGSFFAIFKNKYVRILCVLAIALVAFSRLYLCVHTPLDVFTSLLVTVLCIVIISYFHKILMNNKKYDHVIALIVGIASILIAIYSLILALSSIIDIKQINDCFKSGGAGVGFAIGWYIERKYINFDVRCEKIWMQAVKLIIGVAGALVIKELIKVIAEGNLAVDFIRYFFAVMWVLVIFPILFTKTNQKLSQKVN